MNLEPSKTLRANRPEVIDETFDDEAVVVHLGTGRYYALNAAGTVVWKLIRDGSSPDDVAAALRDEQGDAAQEFVARLLGEGLLVAGDSDGRSAPVPEIAADEWADPPRLQSFDDLRELLLLDPIHEIKLGPDGWPVAEK